MKNIMKATTGLLLTLGFGMVRAEAQEIRFLPDGKIIRLDRTATARN